MITVVNVISSPIGGGAELLVRELHKLFLKENRKSYAVFLSGATENSVKNEVTLSKRNCRSPINILRLRKLITSILRETDDKIIVHAHLTWPFLYVALACLGLPRVRLVYTEHSTSNRRRSVPVLRVIERNLYSRYSQVICISEGVKRSLSEWVGSTLSKRLVTVQNGSRMYPVAKRNALHDRLPTLISIGSLTKRKNFVTAVNAVSLLQDQIEKYIIVGEGPERARLEELISELGLEHKISLVGWKSNLKEYFHASDIQVIPSLWEGFGLVAVEGMSTGLPIVASNVDGLVEVINLSNPSVTLVNEPRSENEWATSINRAIKMLEIKGPSFFSYYSRRQAEKFSLEKMAKEYLNVYEHIMRLK